VTDPQQINNQQVEAAVRAVAEVLDHEFATETGGEAVTDDALAKRIVNVVLAQQVEEEPRYTLEQVREGLLSAEALNAAEVQRQAGRRAATIVNAALVHFTQQPAGVGAGLVPSQEFHSAPGDPVAAPRVSADSDGNHQPLGGRQDDVLEVVEEVGAALESQKEHVDKPGAPGQGAGSAPYETEVRIVSRPGVAGGAPMVLQGVGVRVVDLVGRVRAGESVEAVATDFNVDADSVSLLVDVADALTQQPSDGQEGDQ